MINKGRIMCMMVALTLFAATSALGAAFKVAVIESLSGPQASTGIPYRTATRYGIDSHMITREGPPVPQTN